MDEREKESEEQERIEDFMILCFVFIFSMETFHHNFLRIKNTKS